MDHIINAILAYWTAHHDAILALAAPGGLLLSTVIQWFLHRFKIHGDRLSFAISHIFALATAVSAYFLDSVHPNVGVTYGWVWIAAQVWHRYAVNPSYKKYVLPFLAWLAKQNAAKAVAPAVVDAAPVPDAPLE